MRRTCLMVWRWSRLTPIRACRAWWTWSGAGGSTSSAPCSLATFPLSGPWTTITPSFFGNTEQTCPSNSTNATDPERTPHCNRNRMIFFSSHPVVGLEQSTQQFLPYIAIYSCSYIFFARVGWKQRQQGWTCSHLVDTLWWTEDIYFLFYELN